MAARSHRRLVRPVAGLLLLGAVLMWAGPASAARGLAAVDPRAVGIALLATLVGTVASAARWVGLARRAGLDLSLGEAVRAYYRSQLLNAVLPGGFAGDVDRALRHGRVKGSVRTAGRTVLLDRVAGQLATTALTVTLLGATDNPLRSHLGPAASWAALGAAVLLVLGLAREPVLVGASLVAALAHAATFVAAATAVGVTVPVGTLLPVALVVLAGGALPLNVAGWGPREGVAAWAFVASGLGAGAGLAVAVAHGVLTLLAVAPGAALLARRAGPAAAAAPAPLHPAAST